MLHMTLTAKKVDYMFEEKLNSLFSLPMQIPGENRAKLKELFTLKSRLKMGEQYSKYSGRTSYSPTAVIQVIFLTKNNFCFSFRLQEFIQAANSKASNNFFS